MSEDRADEIDANLERADASLSAARDLLAAGHFDFAASRAYYAAFYAATAALLTDGFEFRKHSGVIAAVHQRFVKTGRLSQELGKDLNWLFALRAIGDYGEMRHVPEIDARHALDAANRFVTTIRAMIRQG